MLSCKRPWSKLCSLHDLSQLHSGSLECVIRLMSSELEAMLALVERELALRGVGQRWGRTRCTSFYQITVSSYHFLTSGFEDVFSESLGLIMATAPGNSWQICTSGIIGELNGWLKLRVKTMKTKFSYLFLWWLTGDVQYGEFQNR